MKHLFLSFALAATALTACTTDDEVLPHDGDAALTIGLSEYDLGAAFYETDGYLDVIMGQGVLADSNSSSGLPWVTFTLAYDKDAQVGYGVSNLTVREGDRRLLVMMETRKPVVARYATDGVVRVLESRYAPTDDSSTLIEISGYIDVTLEGERHMTGDFTAVRKAD